MKTAQGHTAAIQPVADSVSHNRDTVSIQSFPVGEAAGMLFPGYDFESPTQYNTPSQTLVSAGSAAEVFGRQSQLKNTGTLTVPPVRAENRQYMNGLLLDGLAVFLFLFLFIHLARYRSSLGVLLRALFTPGQFDALIEEQSVTFRKFVRNSSLLGGLSLLVMGFRWCILWNETPSAVVLPESFTPYLLPLLIGALLAILIYKRIITGIIAILTGKSEPIDKIHTFNGIFMTTASLVLAPVALLSGLADINDQGWVFVVQFIVLIIFLLYYIGKSFSFFVSRKISILQWILYLCAVEIWPVSFFVLFALRGFTW